MPTCILLAFERPVRCDTSVYLTSREIYRLLRDNGVLDAALQLDIKGRNGYQKLMERVPIGYLWGEDTLDSNRFKFILNRTRKRLSRRSTSSSGRFVERSSTKTRFKGFLNIGAGVLIGQAAR